MEEHCVGYGVNFLNMLLDHAMALRWTAKRCQVGGGIFIENNHHSIVFCDVAFVVI